ncbi:MFS general substrate transporter [Polyporus arcularius HHB13444]|uniref:MFS general substrate transporter n=1 Tax=Polyporus arcularius HHB13444 TaxID=1314778 RepID=A0A5C3P9U1_9APHY|nr:MFS general substrate transporter [Polyporus arcularius HHB13444]
MDATEESPLLTTPASADPEMLKHELLYKRFTPSEKKVIVAVISWAAFIPFLASGSFIPSIPEIARELGSTGPIINLAVSLSLTAVSVGSLIWATYSGTYGRRAVFLGSLPCLCVGSIGVATAHSVPVLMFWRAVQAFGASSGMSVGAGVIGDIYRLEERGTAMGIFFGASLLGPAISPLYGGIATHYASWRYGQWGLFIMGLFAFVPVYLWLPETLDPEVLNRHKERGRWLTFLHINPFSSLGLLRSPNIFVLTLAGTAALLTDFVLAIPLAYTIGKEYNISNEALIGAFFLPQGLGNIIGAPTAGRMSDRTVIYWRKRRGGKWVPEDRLRAALWGAGFFTPVSVLLAGITIKYVPGTPGIILNLIWLFMNGIGIDFTLTPLSSYYVDILHSRSAQTMAAAASVRALIIAFTTAGFLPLINKIGVFATDALFAVIAWLGFGLLLLTIRYGDRMRAWVDMGYSTVRDN